MFKAVKQHIADAEMTYFQHQRVAFKYAAQCFYAGFMACVHGIVPSWYETSASTKVASLAQKHTSKK